MHHLFPPFTRKLKKAKNNVFTNTKYLLYKSNCYYILFHYRQFYKKKKKITKFFYHIKILLL